MTAENRDITLARLGEWYLHDLDAAAVKHCQRKIVNTAKAKRRSFNLPGLALAAFSKSAQVLNSLSSFTKMKDGPLIITATGVMSFIVHRGLFPASNA